MIQVVHAGPHVLHWMSLYRTWFHDHTGLQCDAHWVMHAYVYIHNTVHLVSFDVVLPNSQE